MSEAPYGSQGVFLHPNTATFKNYCKSADQESPENLASRAHPSLVYKNE